MVNMTREGKYRKGIELEEEGLSAQQIADRLGFENIAHGGQRLTPVINHAVHERLPGQFNRQRNRDNDAEENDETVHDDIGDLTEHTDAHARDLTALGHILCVKTHDETPGKSGTGQKSNRLI